MRVGLARVLGLYRARVSIYGFNNNIVAGVNSTAAAGAPGSAQRPLVWAWPWARVKLRLRYLISLTLFLFIEFKSMPQYTRQPYSQRSKVPYPRLLASHRHRPVGAAATPPSISRSSRTRAEPASPARERCHPWLATSCRRLQRANAAVALARLRVVRLSPE